MQSQFQQFIGSEFHKGLINHALASLPSAVFQRCPSLVSQESKVTVLKPVTFSSSGRPNAGMWKEAFPVSGCGNDTILNFYFTVEADQKVNTIIGLPGTTRGDLVLQKDAVKYALISVLAIAKPCRNLIIKNTFVNEFKKNEVSPESIKSSAWDETWVLTGCERNFEVTMGFIHNISGITIFASNPHEI